MTRVGRLTLTAPDDDHVRRGAILVEDAMRIATMPAAAQHRVYLVRHLDIGVIAADASPQTIALQIERRLEHVQLTAVPAVTAAAATARAVWFADEPTAIAELARRLVHARPSEWFWPHVASGAVKQPQLRDALLACLAAAARTQVGALAVAAVLDAIESERAGAVLASLEEREARALVAASFGPAATLDGPPRFQTGAIERILPRWRSRLVQVAARWAADVRTLWLAALARIATRGAVAAPAHELDEARALVLEAVVHPRALESTPPVATARLIRFESPPRTAVTVEAAADGVPTTAARARPEALVRPAEPLTLEITATTAAAGALFLLRPLAMLGIADWLAAHPWTAGVNWAAQLLAAIARAHAGPTDALAELLSPDAALLDGPFVAPVRWAPLLGRRPLRVRPTARSGRVLESTGRLPLAAWHGSAPELPFAHRIRRGAPAPDCPWAAVAWQRALARWLRTFAQLRLADVVLRPAELSATPTHIDLIMPLGAVSTAIRAAGLDIDPGWVPWLGRVVRFHYRR